MPFLVGSMFPDVFLICVMRILSLSLSLSLLVLMLEIRVRLAISGT